MTQSMTGYGRAQGTYKGRSLVVELRSVNHRYCDVALHLPKFLAPLEETIKKKVQGRFSRGHIDLSVSLNGASGGEKRFQLDLELAKTHLQLLKKLKSELHLSGEIDLGLLVRSKDLISVVESAEDPSALLDPLEKVLGKAMQALEKTRREEGRVLVRDLSKRLTAVTKVLAFVRSSEKEVITAFHRRLEAKATELAKGLIDPTRLAQEVALFAERSDFSEEIARLGAHIEQFHKILLKEEPVGRALDFLLQEMNREVNTIGSKANDAAISLQVVEMKSELEKLREQVQNIE